MKVFLKVVLFKVLFMLIFSGSTLSSPNAGFYLPDSLKEVTLKFRTVNNLILLPVVINDSIHLNLILDTGCRNLVLFGKRFQKLFAVHPTQKVKFSGLGSGDPVYGQLSLGNKVSIGAVIGDQIPVIVVPNQNILGSYQNVHGVIGYDVFVKFEVELNSLNRLITFRPAVSAEVPYGFTRIPIRIEDSRPLIDCEVVFSKENSQLCNLMIDTGSTLGLLLKTTSLKNYPKEKQQTLLGRGFNGDISGIKTTTRKLILHEIEFEFLETGIMLSPWHNYASIGMDVLKDYSLVLNYCKSYVGFKKL